MAGLFQVSDTLNFGKFAWDVYQAGWQDDLKAAKQYADFGGDVHDLAENLRILGDIVENADKSFRRQGGGSTAPLRWDATSLKEITGSYEETLVECRQLLEENERYRIAEGAVRNLEWNVLVQPTANRLRQRIQLHTLKIQQVLKPFEIDLLSRVNQDLASLTNKINDVHEDLRLLIGILVPDLRQALEQQRQHEGSMLPIPDDIDKAFGAAIAREAPPALPELADAFTTCFRGSTRHFHPGLLVEYRRPSEEQYLNLLKCIWLMKRMKISLRTRQLSPDSHWPSYVRQLEGGLSVECSRFSRDMLPPNITSLDPASLLIWPPRETSSLVNVVTKDVLMEEILNVSLQGPTNVARSLQVLRKINASSQRFRMILSAAKQTPGGYIREQDERIDFGVNSIMLKPLYAIPNLSHRNFDMTLENDEKNVKLSFRHLKDVLKFQQAITGYKAWDYYCQSNVMVTFVVSDGKKPFTEEACLQLWYPKQLGGTLIMHNSAKRETRSEPTIDMEDEPPSNRASTIYRNPTPPLSHRESAHMSFESTRTRTPSVASFTSTSYLPTPRDAPASTRMHSFSSVQNPFSNSSLPNSPRPSSQFSRDHRPQSVLTTATSNHFPPPPRTTRTHSLSNTFSSSRSSTSRSSGSSNTGSSSSNSNQTITTVSLGAQGTGVIRTPPVVPQLVLFTRDPSSGTLALITVQLDDATEINPQRCECRRRTQSHDPRCPVAAIERDRGGSNLNARRSLGWDIAALVAGRGSAKKDGKESTVWKNVKRISIEFESSAARGEFGGIANGCRCKVKDAQDLKKCFEQRHRGVWGEVREHYREKATEYYARKSAQRHVVIGTKDDSR